MLKTRISQMQATMIVFGMLWQFILTPPLKAQPSQDSTSPKKSINVGVFFGPGLLVESKKIILQASSTSKMQEKTLTVNEGDESFKEIKKWIGKNLLTSLNHSRDSSEESPEYSVWLFSEMKNGISNVLIGIPLGKNILGPTYLQKQKELLDLMTTKNKKEV